MRFHQRSKVPPYKSRFYTLRSTFGVGAPFLQINYSAHRKTFADRLIHVRGNATREAAFRSRYARALETAPDLMAVLNDQSTQETDLRHEVGLARMLLEQVLQQLGAIHARTGALNPLAFEAVARMLAQVQSTVTASAAIEAKRADQRISATHVLTLLVSLRDDLKRRLAQAFGDTASQIVEDVFVTAKWTGGLRDEDVKDALLEPAAFDLRLRVVDREGDVLKEAATAKGLNSQELLAIAADASEAEQADPLAIPEAAAPALVEAAPETEQETK